MSPLSDTTNLAPAMAGATLFDHIRHMIWTVTPSICIALVIYLIYGIKNSGGSGNLDVVESMKWMMFIILAYTPISHSR